MLSKNPFKSEKQRRYLWKFHPEIAARWSDEMKRNPLRENTPTMLPDDAGAFVNGYSWSNEDRKCYIKDSKETWLNALKGPFEGKFQEITEKVTKITLPNKKEIKVKKIGKGHATTAYLGEDRWVYLVTSDKSGDKSKEILSEFHANKEACKHIPYVEKIGFISKRGGTEYSLYRMPWYKTIRATDKKAYKQLRELDKILGSIRLSGMYGRPLTRYDWITKAHDSVESSATLLPSIKQAVIDLCDHLIDYDGDWRFETGKNNIAVDEEGNLVLLDFFFDKNALDNFRKHKW